MIVTDTTTVVEYAYAMSKVRDKYADDFFKLFHVPLKRFWHNLTGLDIVKLDIEIVQCRDSENMNKATMRKFGKDAANLIFTILDASKPENASKLV